MPSPNSPLSTSWKAQFFRLNHRFCWLWSLSIYFLIVLLSFPYFKACSALFYAQLYCNSLTLRNIGAFKYCHYLPSNIELFLETDTLLSQGLLLTLLMSHSLWCSGEHSVLGNKSKLPACNASIYTPNWTLSLRNIFKYFILCIRPMNYVCYLCRLTFLTNT